MGWLSPSPQVAAHDRLVRTMPGLLHQPTRSVALCDLPDSSGLRRSRPVFLSRMARPAHRPATPTPGHGVEESGLLQRTPPIARRFPARGSHRATDLRQHDLSSADSRRQHHLVI